MTDDELKAVLVGRTIDLGRIDNFFDLAEWVLNDQFVHDALARCDRATLAALRIVSEEATAAGITESALEARLVEFGAAKTGAIGVADLAEKLERAVKILLADRAGDDDSIHPCEVVTRQFTSWPPHRLPSTRDLVATVAPTPLDPSENRAGHLINQIAAERAFATIIEISEFVFELKRHPVRELSRGGMALLDSRRLAAAASVEVVEVSSLLSIASRTQLVAVESGRWLITELGERWLSSAIALRWTVLATMWQGELLPEVREALAATGEPRWGEDLSRYLGWLYPASGARFSDGLDHTAGEAEKLGIAAHGVLSAVGKQLIVEGVDDAAHAMRASFPQEVRRAYVQPDLTVVSGGPLEPDVDERLRTIADVESRALSTSYRISSVSLNRALAAGETAESILEFLTVVSLSGLPQPVEYLVLETAKRHGTMRVGEIANSANAASYVRSGNAHLLRTALVDQALAALSLSPDGDDRLVSSVDHGVVFRALSNARYPVAAETPGGSIITAKSYRVAAPPVGSPTDALETAINRLRASASSSDVDPERAWIARQLDRAIKEKSAVTVTFASPDGSTNESVLEPSSIAGGRKRARDRDADIERTHPLSCISVIEPAMTNSSADG